MNKEKIWRSVIANIAIVLVVCGVIATTFGTKIASVFGNDGLSAIYRGDSEKPNIALMVNVYWGTEYLDKMLAEMDKRGVKCTFFVGGTWVAQNNEMLTNIAAKGHEIGNHGYYHKDHSKLNVTRNQEEILVTERVVEGVLGVKTKLFAPPSGAFNKTVLKVSNDLGYKTIMWSKDTIDWRDKNEQLIFNRATQKAANGDLILMHPTEATANILGKIIDTLQAKGYTLTTVSETLGAV